MASVSRAPAPRDGVVPPTGTVTFLFTDIEGSIERWDAHREAMSAAVLRHDEIGRAAMVAHSGYVFKALGDAFCVAFARPEAAVAAALDFQGALATEDFAAVGGLRVRAALHTGAADERDSDYFGPTLNRVARLLAIGHGGQTLLSGVMHALVLGALPSQVSLRDLGEHRLKDLSRPENVYQLVAPGLASEFPALRSLESMANNLPLQMTSFVGREREVAEITELLGTRRLVTLVGSGGIGKTRTSLQVAANLLDGSGNGVWLIELAPLASGEYIPAAIAQALGLSLPPEGDALAHLVMRIKSWETLLVFDNCEHLIDASAKSIAALLRGCPKVSVLASSRQGIGVAGEATYRLPSLAVGDVVTDGLSATDAAAAPAVAAEREHQRPGRPLGRSAVPGVHGIQPCRGELGGLASGQERDAADGRGDRRLKTGERGAGDQGRPLLLRTVQARQHHVRLQDHCLQRHTLRVQRIEHGAQYRMGHLAAPLNRVAAVHQHLGLDDRHEAGLLAQGGVAGQRMRVGRDAAWAGQAVTDAYHGPPLGETRTHQCVLLQPGPQPVQTLGDLLAGMQREGLGADIHLDPWDHARFDEPVDEPRAVPVALPDGLVIQDGAADMHAQARRRHEQLAIGAPGRLGLRDPGCGEALVAGARALIHREQAAAGADEGLRRAREAGGAQIAAPHIQSRISGRSSPCLSM